MTQITRSSFVGKPVFVGIDVHLQSYSVVALTSEGKPVRVTMPAEPEALIRFLHRRFEGAFIRTAYEAGFSGFCLHRELKKQGIQNIVVNPSSVPVSSLDRVKTDKRDAFKLATLLKAGALRGIHIPSEKEEKDRLISRTRSQIVKEQSRIAIQIKSKLRQFGHLPHIQRREISLKFLKNLGAMGLCEELRVTIETLGRIWRYLSLERRKLEKELSAKIAPIKRAQIYQTVPGIGPISCAVLVHELGNLKRFENVRALYSYTGLTPAEYSSGPHVRKGHITRQGNARLRGVLVEVAWRAIRKDSSLNSIYQNIKHRRGAKRAIVAVARHLVGRIRACGLNDASYKLVA